MQINSRKSDVYVLARKYTVINIYDHDGTNIIFVKFCNTSE